MLPTRRHLLALAASTAGVPAVAQQIAPPSTTNLYYLLRDDGFSSFAIGWSTAAGIMLFAVFGVVAIFGLRLMRRSDDRAV